MTDDHKIFIENLSKTNEALKEYLDKYPFSENPEYTNISDHEFNRHVAYHLERTGDKSSDLWLKELDCEKKNFFYFDAASAAQKTDECTTTTPTPPSWIYYVMPAADVEEVIVNLEDLFPRFLESVRGQSSCDALSEREIQKAQGIYYQQLRMAFASHYKSSIAKAFIAIASYAGLPKLFTSFKAWFFG